MLDKPSELSYTVYMLRVKDGWPLVKFLSRGGGVRVSHDYDRSAMELV